MDREQKLIERHDKLNYEMDKLAFDCLEKKAHLEKIFYAKYSELQKKAVKLSREIMEIRKEN